MVQVVENWADVTGTVEGTSADERRPGYVRVSVGLHESREVPGFPDLMRPSVGSTVDILIPAQQGAGLRTGQQVTGRVRRAGPTDCFAGPEGLRRAERAGRRSRSARQPTPDRLARGKPATGVPRTNPGMRRTSSRERLLRAADQDSSAPACSIRTCSSARAINSAGATA